MGSKNDAQRAELQNAIWKIANDLRGAVDGWDFKQYVLGTLFYKYISENLALYINENEWEAGDKDFRYENLSDEDAETIRDEMINDKGFFILPSELFCNVCKKAEVDNSNLNEVLDRVFDNIEKSSVGSKSEKDFKGLFEDYDVNSNKLGGTVAERNKRLKALLDGINSMKLGDINDHSIDTFGDAYEFLMTMYAANAGKSGGEFFTPQCCSRLVSLLALDGRTKINKCYDPACGSGSLLLQAGKIIGTENIQQGFFGQEINITTYNLCRINMFLHNVPFNKFDIAYGDTLTDPKHWDDEPFDMEVANMPYSIPWAGDSDVTLINDDRYSPAGVLAPKTKADFAFIMHMLSWLSPKGTAAVVCFPGIMYRGGAEQKIRKYLVDNNYVDTIIQLPDNLFFGTSIATCIMRLKKNRENTDIFFVDASNVYTKANSQNELSEDNIQTIYKQVMDREDKEHFAKKVSYEDVKENDYNLSVSTYIEKEDTSEKVDIKVLNQQIKDIVARENELRKQIDEIIAEIEGDDNE